MKKPFLLLASAFFCLQPFSSNASAAASLSAKLNQCGTISQDSKRLACFDALLTVDGVKEAPKAQVNKVEVLAAPVAKVQPKLSEKQQVDDFAEEHLKKTKEEQGPESISSSITKLKKMLRGQWIISLANGQKWQQRDSGKLKLKVGNMVRLEKGMMGAVYLYKEGSNRSISVKRIK
jgi:hypothetical protein